MIITSKIRYSLLLLVVLVGLLATSVMLFSPIEGAPGHPPAPPVVTPQATSLYVDSTDDLRALGYPDSRKIARDAQGNLYIGYRKTYPAGTGVPRIFVAKSTDNGQSWFVVNDNQPIETVGSYIQRVPSLVIDHHNTLHVVWYGLDASSPGNEEHQIKYVRSTDGGNTWTTWRNIAPVPGYQGGALWQEHPTIYVDVNNIIYIVWQGSDTPLSQIKFIKSTDGGQSWSPWRTINPKQINNYSRPVLLASKDGAILYLLAYRNTPQQAQIVWSRSLNGGTTWTAWRVVAADNHEQRHISAAIDNLNHLHVVWRQIPVGASASAKVQVHYAIFDGTEWTASEIPAAQPDQNQFFPSITVDVNNNPWLVWTATAANSGYPKEDPSVGLIYYTTKINGVWHAPIRLTNTASTYASLIQQVSSAHPAIDVVWLENQTPSEGLICHYSLDRVLNMILPDRSGACEVAAPNAAPLLPLATPIETPTKTPKRTKAPTRTPKPRLTETATETPIVTATPTETP